MKGHSTVPLHFISPPCHFHFTGYPLVFPFNPIVCLVIIMELVAQKIHPNYQSEFLYSWLITVDMNIRDMQIKIIFLNYNIINGSHEIILLSLCKSSSLALL